MEEGEERKGDSVPPWLRGTEDDDAGDEKGSSSNTSPSSSSSRPRRRFPRELEPLVALFLQQGARYDLLSVKMLSARQAWGMAGVRPAGDDGSGFILGAQAQAPPSTPPPSASSSSSPADPKGQQQRKQKQWQEELQQSQNQHARAAFIFRLEVCAGDGCWELRDVARVGGGGESGGGAFSLGG